MSSSTTAIASSSRAWPERRRSAGTCVRGMRRRRLDRVRSCCCCCRLVRWRGLLYIGASPKRTRANVWAARAHCTALYLSARIQSHAMARGCAAFLGLLPRAALITISTRAGRGAGGRSSRRGVVSVRVGWVGRTGGAAFMLGEGTAGALTTRRRGARVGHRTRAGQTRGSVFIIAVRRPGGRARAGGVVVSRLSRVRRKAGSSRRVRAVRETYFRVRARLGFRKIENEI